MRPLKTLGHQNSDRILELASRSLNAITRELPGIISLGQHNGRRFFVASLDPETFACVVDANISESTRRSVVRALEAIRMQLRNRLLKNGHHFNLSVNISPNNLREPDFPLFVQRLMSAHPEHRGAIIFEITETSMMQDPANALKALNSLANAGIPVSIDDFGSGYSSLSYIKQLPASEIKIDRSLITDLATREEDRVIVQTTINICHSLGYLVIAEGVADEATASLLKGMGCDMIQGYLLSRPLTFEHMLIWLAQRRETATARHAP